MGAKTALLAFSDGDIRPVLRGATRSDRTETEALVRQVHPGHYVEPAGEKTRPSRRSRSLYTASKSPTSRCRDGWRSVS
ncbi:DUF6928 family protein [Actinomadura spongiicola]|uniref:DUF6928 family protein n=1 Tax=Actinomadura spongiicola TaxID=2303421 RepID=UPI0038991CB5